MHCFFYVIAESKQVVGWVNNNEGEQFCVKSVVDLSGCWYWKSVEPERLVGLVTHSEKICNVLINGLCRHISGFDYESKLYYDEFPTVATVLADIAPQEEGEK